MNRWQAELATLSPKLETLLPKLNWIYIIVKEKKRKKKKKTLESETLHNN